MGTKLEVERERYSLINFEETELRLGLPGDSTGNDGEAAKNGAKRGFSETVDLKLNLSSKDSAKNEVSEKMKEKSVVPPSNDPARPPAKYVYFSNSFTSIYVRLGFVVFYF